jgi:hypothetical protein
MPEWELGTRIADATCLPMTVASTTTVHPERTSMPSCSML